MTRQQEQISGVLMRGYLTIMDGCLTMLRMGPPVNNRRAVQTRRIHAQMVDLITQLQGMADLMIPTAKPKRKR